MADWFGDLNFCRGTNPVQANCKGSGEVNITGLRDVENGVIYTVFYTKLHGFWKTFKTYFSEGYCNESWELIWMNGSDVAITWKPRGFSNTL